MTGHNQEEDNNNSIVLKINQHQQLTNHHQPTSQDSDDEVKEAITKLQLNGVNCVIFRKKNLLDKISLKSTDQLTSPNSKTETTSSLIDYTCKKEGTGDEQTTPASSYEHPIMSEEMCGIVKSKPEIRSINSVLSASVDKCHQPHKSTSRPRGRPPGNRRSGSGNPNHEIGRPPLSQQFPPGHNLQQVSCKDGKRGRGRPPKSNLPTIFPGTLGPYNLRRFSNFSIEKLFPPNGIHFGKRDDKVVEIQIKENETKVSPLPNELCSQEPDIFQVGTNVQLISDVHDKIPHAKNVGAKISGPVETTSRLADKVMISTPIRIPLPPDSETISLHVLDTMNTLLDSVVKNVDIESKPFSRLSSLDKLGQKPFLETFGDKILENQTNQGASFKCPEPDESSLPLIIPNSAMKLRHSTPDGSFYSLVTNNVRHNLENYLDGQIQLKNSRKKGAKRKRYKNGFLLYHGDNYPGNPELSYKLNLTTQILLKLNRKRYYSKPKVDKRKTLLSYLNLVSKRPMRTGKSSKNDDSATKEDIEKTIGVGDDEEKSVFSGEWTRATKLICGVCQHVEINFWNMVMHKGEEHPGIIVTHVELPITQEVPNTLIRERAPISAINTRDNEPPPSCTKCFASFGSSVELYRHIFSCAGNSNWLKEPVPVTPQKKTRSKRRRRQGFKRRLSSNSPKKNVANPGPSTASPGSISEISKNQRGDSSSTTTSSSPVGDSSMTPPVIPVSPLYQCTFCTKNFKTEGWWKNHIQTHTLLVKIPLDKLLTKKKKSSLPQSLLTKLNAAATRRRRASNWSLRKYSSRASSTALVQ